MKPTIHSIARGACIIGLTIAYSAVGGARGQIRPSDVQSGPAPTAQASEIPSASQASYRESADQPFARPNHPPIATIPPMPMRSPYDPTRQAAAPAVGPGYAVGYNPATRQALQLPVDTRASLSEFRQGGGYRGADGGPGEEQITPATMSGSMSLLSDATRATFPYRMNAKIVMRFGSSYFVCSGTMRDAETVLTAGHCVFDAGPGGAGWADEIWVYPGWDGDGSIVPGPSTTMNPYGWARGTFFASWSFWVNDENYNYDVGLIEVTRAVGMLTGWFGWSSGGSCGYWQSTFVNSGSYPSEFCGGSLHNGQDMYFWGGTFDACFDTNQLQLNTVPGCLNAIWGGQSGSGVYEIVDGNRYVHGITSRSDRSTIGLFARQWDNWVNYGDGTFVPGARGGAFDIQPLDVNLGPSTIVSGGSTTTLTHLASNPTNGAANGTWTYNVYLSSNDNIEPTDTLLSSQFVGVNFAPMQNWTINMVQVTIPANTPAGNYWIGVIYDSGQDADSSNNDTDGWDAAPITVTNRDLDITLVSAPASAEPGEMISVSNTVQNIGNANAGAFTLGLYLSADATCTTSDTFLGSRAIASLNAGLSNNANTAVTIPASATPGARNICAIADSGGAIPEVNENNNTGFDPITIVQPDLDVTAVNAPALAAPGSAVNVANTVQNIGNGPAGAFVVGLYLSADATCTTGDTFLTSRNVAGLAAGASSGVNTPVTIPAATPFSSRFICVIADTGNAEDESNESNNTGNDPLDIVSAVPTVTLKVNGIDAAVVNTTGPYHLTLDIAASVVTTPVDWYWALVVNGSVMWVTPGGLSTTPAPVTTAVPSPLTNLTLLNITLPAGTTLTSALFLVQGSTVLSSDLITTTATTSAPAGGGQ